MPRGDSMGPRGMGPRTGRAAGYCAGYDMPGYANPVPRFGGWCGGGFWGRGGSYRGRGGGGRGWRHGYYATGLPGWQRFGPAPAPEALEEHDALQEELAWLENRLEAVRGRLDELKGEDQG